MKKSIDIILWITAVLVPLTIFTTILLLVLRPPRARPAPVVPLDHTIPPNFEVGRSMCGMAPIPCNLNAPSSCDACGDGWTCSSVGANDTDFGVEGSFCLPARPTSACTQMAVDTNERMPGVWRWSGWAGVNVQKWECACPYPTFYPMDTTSGSTSAGACKRSSDVCRGGTWTYPCKHPTHCTNPNDPTSCTLDLDACMPLSQAARDAVVGEDVLKNGQCKCADGDRLAMAGGLPVCVRDTCTATPPCTPATPCPGNASCVDGTCARLTSSCETNQDCGKGGVCENDGTCTWGHWSTLPLSPYVFGECDCPDGCYSVGSLCACPAALEFVQRGGKCVGIPSKGPNGPRTFESVFPSKQVCEDPGEASQWTPLNITVDGQVFEKKGTGNVNGVDGTRMRQEDGKIENDASDMKTCFTLCKMDENCKALNYRHAEATCDLATTDSLTGTGNTNISAYAKK